MVKMRNLVKVGNREVKKRYIGNKLIFEDLGDKTEVLSGEEIFTDKADDSVVHVEIDGKSYQHAGSGNNLFKNFPEIQNGFKYEHIDRPGEGGLRIEGNAITQKLVSSETYTISLNIRGLGSINLYRMSSLGNSALRLAKNSDLSESEYRKVSLTFTPHRVELDAIYICTTYKATAYTSWFEIEPNSLMLEKGGITSEYEPPLPTPDYPIEIHSLNDFDVVSSVGKENLLENVNGRPASMARGGSTPPTVELVNMETPFGNEAFKITFPANNNTGYAGSRAITNNLIMYSGKSYSYHTYVYFPDGNASGVLMYPTGQVGMNPLNPDSSKNIGEWRYYRRENYSLSSRFKTANNYMTYYASSRFSSPKTIYVSIVKFEEGVEATPYSPRLEDIAEGDNHPLIDKINLSLSEPLRSVGDVKDRLFRDSDGLWKVERNIGEWILNGSESWAYEPSSKGYYIGLSGKLSRDANTKSSQQPLLSSHFRNVEAGKRILSVGDFRIGSNTNILINYDDGVVGTSGFKKWLSTNNVKIIDQLATPTTETLPDDIQDKLNNLRSFQDSNYVYTAFPDKSDNISEKLKPTLHTTFKSKGWYDYYLKTLLK